MIDVFYDDKTMTLDELISALQQFRTPENCNLPVLTEGCDCYGTTTGIELIPDGDTAMILITRDN